MDSPSGAQTEPCWWGRTRDLPTHLFENMSYKEGLPGPGRAFQKKYLVGILLRKELEYFCFCLLLIRIKHDIS